jgi:hypothetical protein
VLSRIEFMFLGLVWGASFALYRVAIPELGLAVTVALRLLLAATPCAWCSAPRCDAYRWAIAGDHWAGSC